MRRPSASSGINVDQGHTKDGPIEEASQHPGFALPVFSAESRGRRLSQAKRAQACGSWPATYTRKS